MSDKTFGVKVSEELFEKVKMMIENSGSTSKEWFEKAVALTEVQELKTGAGDYKQDLSELEVHTTRIYELVANMIQRANYLKDDAVRELDEKLYSRESTITSLQANVKELSEQLNASQGELKQHEADRKELNEQLEGLRSMNTNNQALIKEYKEKIDTLSSLVNEYKGYASENVELKAQFANEKEEMQATFAEKEQRMTSSIEESNDTIRSQGEQIDRLEKEIESMKANQVNQLTALMKEKDLERERAVLETERQYQAKLQEIHESYNEKLSRLYERLEKKQDEGKADNE